LNLTRAVAGTIGTRIIAYTFAAVTGILIARLLGPADRGVYGVLISTTSILHAIGALGIGSANVYYIARNHSVNSIVNNSLGIGLGVSVLLITCFLLFFLATQEQLFPGVTVILILVAVAGTPAVLFHGYFSGILLGQSRIAVLNLLTIGIGFLQLVAIMMLMIFLKVGILELLSITLVIASLNAGVIIYLVKQSEGVHINFALDLAIIRQMVRFSGAAYVANLLHLIATRSDILLLYFFVGGTTVGHYAVAVMFAQMFLLVPESVQRVMLVRFSSSNIQAANQLIPLVHRTILVLMLILALISALLAGPVLGILLGAQYEASAMLFTLLLPGVVAGASRGMTSSYLAGRGRPDVSMKVAFACLAIVVGIDLILIPQIGAIGAAIAASAANIAGATLQLMVVLKWSGTRFWDVMFPKRDDLRYILTHLLNRHREEPFYG